MAQKLKSILFVDDEPGLLDFIRQLMGHFAGPAWEIHTAPDVSAALGILQERRIDLVVLDIHLPVVDGLQFLNLLQRKFPNVLKVVLTGDPTEQHRATCLSNGAELFLEKPRDEGGWRTVYATLHELTRFQLEEGFRGVVRRVGLQDVLQMECLARNSSVLRINAGSVRGAVFVKDGQIIHAQCGSRTGEEAFNYLLGLAGGEFDVQPFTAPATLSISGSWEFLLMESARKRDEEGTIPPLPGDSDSGFSRPAPHSAAERHTTAVVAVIEAVAPAIEVPSETEGGAVRGSSTRPQIDELLVCSLQGEVLHEWQCANTNGRVGFLEFLSQKSRQLAQGLPLGEFDRLEVNGERTRVVAQVQPDRALFVRTTRVAAESPEGTARP